MHYYKRHLGDYAKDTGHLSALEHGVYTLLLDWYYANERPIPPDKATRIARGNPDETQTVLSEFFKLTDSGWVHSYADRVIAEYNVKAERNREIGKLGGRPKPKANPEETQTVSKPNPEETLATSHKPLTTNQKSKSTVQRTAARFPDFWEAYPNKKGKQDAEKRWRRDGLDARADEIIAHVRLMTEVDDGWRRGYVPMGSTYLNQARWTDVPQAPPKTNGNHQITVPVQHKTVKQALASTEDRLTAQLRWLRNQVERGMMTESEFNAEAEKARERMG